MSTWRDYVRRVEPYTPGEQPNQPGMIKLNTNENPYPPGTRALQRWQSTCRRTGSVVSGPGGQ